VGIDRVVCYTNPVGTASVKSIGEYVTSTPGVCGGKPCIAGTRIRIQDVYVWHELQGQSVDQIVSRFPQLTHAGVYAALAYFWENREALLEQMKAGDELVEELRQRYPSKLGAKRGGDDANPVSS
jgi:uncharacterized protein (DUF433 family)